jgi:hypothetical protein
MQVDEGHERVQQQHLDLSLTRRLFSRLHPDALATPPAVPSLADFEREYRLIQGEIERVIKAVITGCSQADSQAFISVLREHAHVAAPYITEALASTSADSTSYAALNVLNALS